MRILLIEDDRELSDTVGILLRKEDYTVDFCYDGDDGLYHAQQDSYDLIVLDRMLPELDGMELLRTLRKEKIHTPVLMLTALGAVSDRVDGLDAGADDYLSKPFDANELLARIRAMLRRPLQIEQEQALCCGDLQLEHTQKQLTGPKGVCPLSQKEYEMLEFFMKHPRQTLSRERLFAHVWGPCAQVNLANLDGYVYFVRRRLAAVGSTVQLQTVRGVGMRLEPSC